MSSIPKRHIRLLLSNYQTIRFLKHSQRYAVTVTDEYRPQIKPRASIKGVELLRNPALNKVDYLWQSFVLGKVCVH
jgi:hypothetical protein